MERRTTLSVTPLESYLSVITLLRDSCDVLGLSSVQNLVGASITDACPTLLASVFGVELDLDLTQGGGSDVLHGKISFVKGEGGKALRAGIEPASPA